MALPYIQLHSFMEGLDELFLSKVTFPYSVNLLQSVGDRFTNTINLQKELPHFIEFDTNCASVVVKVFWLQFTLL